MKTTIALAVIALLFSSHAMADTYFVEVTGGYGLYAMDEVNAFIDDLNEDAGGDVLDKLESGGNFGLALTSRMTPRLSGAVTWEHLYASTKTTEGAASLDLNAPANVFKISMAYHLIESGWIQPFIQGGGAIMTTRGHLKWQEGDDKIEHEFKGTGLHLDADLGTYLTLSDRIGAKVTAGYRFAKLNELTYDASSFGGYGSFNGPGVDYSGWTVKLGINIKLNWGSGDEESRPKPETPVENNNQM